MDKRIVIINGTGGSGKDTFVEYVSEYAKTFNFSSVDKVKEIATQIGWNGGKSEKDRKFLSDLKRLTTEYNDMAFRSVENAVQTFQNNDDEMMFIHIREPEEVARAAYYFGAQTLLVKRANLENITSNYSDASVDNYDYDFIIQNTTLENLRQQASSFVEEFRKEDFCKMKK